MIVMIVMIVMMVMMVVIVVIVMGLPAVDLGHRTSDIGQN